MQAGSHLFKFVEVATTQIFSMGCKEGNTVVTPVIFKAFLQQMVVVYESVNWQQLNAGNTEFFNVIQQLLGGEASKRAAQFFWNRRMKHADAAYVGFVNDGF